MKYLVHKKVNFDVSLVLQKDRVPCFESHRRQGIQNEGLMALCAFCEVHLIRRLL